MVDLCGLRRGKIRRGSGSNVLFQLTFPHRLGQLEISDFGLLTQENVAKNSSGVMLSNELCDRFGGVAPSTGAPPFYCIPALCNFVST